MDKIRVILPKRYNLVKGDTFQLFYRGVVEAPNPFCYDILSICEEGKNFPRYFEYTPTEVGSHKLTVCVYDADKNLLGKGETVLEVKEPESSEKPVNILCIGDSLTAHGQWVAESCRRLTSQGGSPSGDGLLNINFIGGCEKDGAGYEAFGGWTWRSFSSTSFDGMWVINMGHNKTDKDQHSIWADEDGNLWQMETIIPDMIKFMRYGKHRAAMKKGTHLIHHSNAENKENVLIQDAFPETVSPFLDKETKTIDFRKYCDNHGYDGIDVVYILLGINGLNSAKGTLREFCENIVNDGKKLVDIIHRDYKNAKIMVSGLFVPSVTGGMGANYGAKLFYGDRYGITRFIFDLNLAYEKWVNEDGYKDFMEFINLSGQFDTDYVMPCEEKTVNVRSKKTELIGTNGVHPSDEGYMQIADAMYRNMVHAIK